MNLLEGIVVLIVALMIVFIMIMCELASSSEEYEENYKTKEED